MKDTIRLQIGLVSTVIWVPKTRKEQDTLSKTSPEKAIDDITSDIKAAPMTTMASKQRMWKKLCLVLKDLTM